MPNLRKRSQDILKFLQGNFNHLQAGATLVSANVIVAVLGLIRTPLVTWLIPKDEVGMLGVVASWVPFLLLLSFSGMDSSAYHFVSKGQVWAFVTGVKERFKWSLLSAGVFFLGAWYWFSTGNSILGGLFIIAGITFPLTYAMTASAGLLGIQKRFSHLFWYRIWESLTDFAGFIPLIFSVWWISRSFTFFSFNQLATLIMQAGISLLLIRELVQKKVTRLTPTEEAAVVTYGKHQTAINGIGVLQSRSDAFLVGILAPLETMANYSIALIVHEQLRKVWGVFSTIRYPEYVKLPVLVRKKQFIREGILAFFSMLLAGIIIIWLAVWLIPVLLPESYSSSIIYINLLVASVVFGVPGSMAEMYFRAGQNQAKQYQMRTVSAFAGITVTLIFTLLWGGIGAAIGRVLSNLLFSLVGVILFFKFSDKVI